MAVAVFAVVWSLGCGRSQGGPGLPPAAGSGIAAPEVPSVAALMSAAPSASASPAGTALSATGTLFAKAEASLGPNASGTLKQIAVREGDRVKKGQLLFRLDSGQAGLAVDQARALLESARVNLRATELEFKRTKELYDRGSLPEATFEQVQARYDLAKSSVAQSEAQLALLQKTAADSVVRSPIDGVVTAKLKNVGETVTMMPPTTVIVVQDVEHLELRARLPERALKQIVPGEKLRVEFPSLGVRRVVPITRVNPTIDLASRTVELVADFDNTDGVLRPGMLADVTLGTDATAAEAKGEPMGTPAKAAGAAGRGAAP
jgi:RND family efflux transporter MFP subunit